MVTDILNESQLAHLTVHDEGSFSDWEPLESLAGREIFLLKLQK
ncbi:hypothetical protein ACFL27_22600 [candidate division CSSED10-310 bacterium]|uniref:Uncharacterized protein n=1 Tax=candidate division CSSED10-310 bacterium TaxID=2855610 RepID=A0ABV6Z3H8_UNCC1